MLATKTLSDGTVENWVWDGLALIRRGDDIYVNEPHISGGGGSAASIEGASPLRCIRYAQNSYPHHDRSARFTGKPYDEDLQAYVFPYRNYDASTARWRTSDPAGYPDGINQHFYAAIPTVQLDVIGMWIITITNVTATGPGNLEVPDASTKVNVGLSGTANVKIVRESGDVGSKTFNLSTNVTGPNNSYSNGTAKVSILSNENSYETTVDGLGIVTTVGVGVYEHTFTISGIKATGSFSVTVEK